MRKKIILEVRTNNNQCTDEEADCSYLGFDHKTKRCWCDLFQCDVHDAVALECLDKQKSVDRTLQQVKEEFDCTRNFEPMSLVSRGYAKAIEVMNKVITRLFEDD